MSEQKKVLILSSVASMIDQFNIPNIKLLIKRGYKVHVACNFIKGSTCSDEQIMKLKEILKSLDVDYYQIDFQRKTICMQRNIRAYRQVVNLMKKNKYHFIHCHSPIGGVIGRLAGKTTKTKVIYTAHGFHFFKGAPLINWIIYYPIERWLSNYTDILITLNEEDYKRAIRFKTKRVEYIAGIGVDIDKFKPQTINKKQKLRQKHGYSEKDFILIYVGELSYRKNQTVLIKTMSILKPYIKNIKLLLVGQGEYYERYLDLIKKLNIKESVCLLGFRDDVPELIGLSDLVVSSSYQEGLPVNIMEAMASGMPLVVSNCRGNKDLVIDNRNGFVVDVDDINAYAKSIIELYNDKGKRAKFANENLAQINKYSKEKINKVMESIYRL